jgi:hypothetical protein
LVAQNLRIRAGQEGNDLLYPDFIVKMLVFKFSTYVVSESVEKTGLSGKPLF